MPTAVLWIGSFMAEENFQWSRVCSYDLHMIKDSVMGNVTIMMARWLPRQCSKI